MKEAQFSWFQVVLGVLLGVAGILSPNPVLRWLGGFALVLVLLLGWNRWRNNTDRPKDLAIRTPELSWLERWFPWFFFSLALAAVLVLTAFTLRQLGLI